MSFSIRDCKGVWSAMSTPLNNDKTVDTDAVAKVVEHQIKLGVKGLFIAGTSGEGPFLPDQERMRLVEATVRSVAGRIPIALQITDNSAERMIENLERYQDTGIDLVVLAPPFFQCRVTPEYIVDLYTKVIDASKLPVGIYNRGKFSSVLVEPDTLGKILDHPKVVMVKDSASQDEYTEAILAAKKRRNGTLAALCGNEFDCIKYIRAGYDGLLFGGACFNGAYANEILRLVAAGEYDQAQELQLHLNSVMYKVFGGEKIVCWLAGQKELMRRLGVFNTSATIINYTVNDECSRAIDEVIRDEKKWLIPEA